MPLLSDPKVREVWRIWIKDAGPEAKRRPCIVLGFDEAAGLEVIFGQENPSPDPETTQVKVELNSPLGKALGIEKDTHFRDTNVRYIKDTTLIIRAEGKCPYDEFTDIESVAFAFHQKYPRGLPGTDK